MKNTKQAWTPPKISDYLLQIQVYSSMSYMSYMKIPVPRNSNGALWNYRQFKNKKIPTCVRNNNTGLTGHSEKGIKQSAQQTFNPEVLKWIIK